MDLLVCLWWWDWKHRGTVCHLVGSRHRSAFELIVPLSTTKRRSLWRKWNQNYLHLFVTVKHYVCITHEPIRKAFVTVEPSGKASFVYSYMQTKLNGQYNGKWPISLACVSKPLITVMTSTAFKFIPSSIIHGLSLPLFALSRYHTSPFTLLTVSLFSHQSTALYEMILPFGGK